MHRTDLLVLTPDDLAAITNRGTVKRAQKEIESESPTCELEEQDGALIFTWSDGITCRFPEGKTIHDAICSSGSLGVTRHIIRSVLAYQRLAAAGPESQNLDEPTAAAEEPPVATLLTAPWDPGTFTDEDLIARFRKAVVTKARKKFEEGVLVELTRGAKPTARFLDQACTVRFLVPGDLRYVHADCAESLLPTWVPLAVWAFRELPQDQLAGLISIQNADLPTPTELLANLDDILLELYRAGLSNVGSSWSGRLMRIETDLRGEGLVWPAELVADLLQQHQLYQQHDARFEPLTVLNVVGELIARTRAIRRATKAVPQPLIRGSKSDRPTEIASGRMIGVGLDVQAGRQHVTLSAYLQDAESGSVVTVERTFADPDPDLGETPRSFSDLAETIVSRGTSLASLGSSQLLFKSGKRTPSGVLILPRGASNVSTNPQSFQWEQLKPPFAAESIAQLRARFDSLPPSYLRPRRRTENLHALSVVAVEEVTFDVAHQRLRAELRDVYGDTAQLTYPFHSRGSAGFDALFDTLQKQGDQIRFVCGHVHSVGRSLEIHPICLVLDDGNHRIGILPALPNGGLNLDPSATASKRTTGERSVLDEFLAELRSTLGDLLVTGVASIDDRTWSELTDAGRQLGFTRLTIPMGKLAEALAARSNRLDWEDTAATSQARELFLLARIAME
ncbi:hypothetical protein DTL42_13155 [Bremerella cremea]|uniref:Uncharacterized protein n=1 Tax=Bremerella cremea TaxID=1031537 RepID=A0A368KRN8_9BACT|nr:hypothetical protein [Bremerella cremea]RCS49466.1 hypothetical protein DTL42_13155 [Bremerella cremea]